MKISFIILTWNSEKYIKNCINSILSIHSCEKQIIIVDNASTDNTVNKINELRNNCITLIRNSSNGGTTQPRNIALKRVDSNSNFICILDSDTIINENAVMHLINILEKDEKCLIAIPKMNNMNGVYQQSCKKFPTMYIKGLKAFPISYINKIGEKLESYDFKDNNEFYYVDYGISACWLMKKDTINKIGYFDEKIFYAPEDVDYCLRVWEQGYKNAYVPNSEIIHDTQRISKKKILSKINFEHSKGLIYYFFKHKYFFSRNRIYRKIKKLE